MSTRAIRFACILLIGFSLGLSKQTWSWTTSSHREPIPFAVDWNRLDARELEALPGIGPKTAERALSALRRGVPLDQLLDHVEGLSASARATLVTQGAGPVGTKVVPQSEPLKPTAAASKAETWVIDVNSATPSQLDELPGIGPILVERIVSARTRAPFRSLDDLVDRVDGLGPKLRDRLRPHLRFSATARGTMADPATTH